MYTRRMTARSLPLALFVILSLVMLSAINRPAAGEIYKWVDEKGTIHFSDVPPPTVQAGTVVEKRSSAPPKPLASDEGPSTGLRPGLRMVSPYEGQASTTLQIAAANGDVAAIEELLAKGEDIEGWDSDKYTPLYLAARWGKLDAVKLLVERGANIDSRSTELSSTPLQIAARHGEAEIVRYLLEKGADVNARNRLGDTALSKLTRFGWQEPAAMAAILIDAGADPNARNNDGATALIYGAAANEVSFLRLLVDRGAAVDSPENHKVGSPLFVAARFGALDAVRLLLERGADVNFNTEGGTPLDAAVRSGHDDIVAVLRARGARMAVELKR